VILKGGTRGAILGEGSHAVSPRGTKFGMVTDVGERRNTHADR